MDLTQDLKTLEFMQHYAVGMYDYACKMNEPFTIYRPSLFIDGNQWCALYGENLQDGVAGFGESPEKAVEDFNKQWIETLRRGQQEAGGGKLYGD